MFRCSGTTLIKLVKCPKPRQNLLRRLACRSSGLSLRLRIKLPDTRTDETYNYCRGVDAIGAPRTTIAQFCRRIGARLIHGCVETTDHDYRLIMIVV